MAVKKKAGLPDGFEFDAMGLSVPVQGNAVGGFLRERAFGISG
jgi:hypothetical protein